MSPPPAARRRRAGSRAPAASPDGVRRRPSGSSRRRSRSRARAPPPRRPDRPGPAAPRRSPRCTRWSRRPGGPGRARGRSAAAGAGRSPAAARARPGPGAYWLAPCSSARTAAAITSGGPSWSGNPWPEVDRAGPHRQRRHLGEDRGRDALAAGCQPRGVTTGHASVTRRDRPDSVTRWPPRSTPRAGSPAPSRSGRGRCRTSTSTSTSSRPIAGAPGAGGRGDGGAGPRGHRAARRPRDGRDPDRDRAEQPDRAAGAVRAQEGQGVRHLQARRGAGRGRAGGSRWSRTCHDGRRGAGRDQRAARAPGPSVEVVVCAIDRSPEGENPLADVGLEVRPVLTKADLDAARAAASASAWSRSGRPSTRRPAPSGRGLGAPLAVVRRCFHHS